MRPPFVLINCFLPCSYFVKPIFHDPYVRSADISKYWFISETANKRNGLPVNVAIATVNHSGQSIVTIASSTTLSDPIKTTTDLSSGVKIKASVATVPVYSESYPSNALPLQVCNSVPGAFNRKQNLSKKNLPSA